ncbi:MAG: hypothetical protein ACKVTZ_20715 [Bacteroidia bacterium]
METFSFFERVMPYLSNPLIFIGFLAMLFIGIFYTLLKAGLVKLSAKDTSNLLTYSFIIALAAIVGGVVYSVATNTESKLPDVTHLPKKEEPNTPPKKDDALNASTNATSNTTPNTNNNNNEMTLEQKIASFKLIGSGEKVKLTFVSTKKGFSMDFEAPKILDPQTVKNRIISHFEFNKDLYDVVGENIKWSLTHNNQLVSDENKSLKDLAWKEGDVVKLMFQSAGSVARKKAAEEF